MEAGGRPARPSPGRGRLAPWQRRLVLLVFSAAFTLLALGAIEGALRLAGYGGYTPTFREIGALPGGGTLFFTDSDGPASYFFADRSRPGSFDASALIMPKPEGVFRVFVVGESAAKGSPYPRHLAAASFLREMLADVWPDRRIEVVNLGATAIASFPVLGIMTEALEFAPDLVVVYAGNNEFYGAYGVASLHTAGRSPWMMRVIRATRSTAIAQVAQRRLRPVPAEGSKTLMEAMVGRGYIAPDDPAREAAARNLGQFIREMVDRCRERGVPVVVCTPPCNERGLAPLGSSGFVDLTGAERIAAEELLRSVRTSDGSDRERALRSLRELLELAPAHALAHYLLAEALAAGGESEESAAAYRRAVDLDPMPWRPPGASVEAVRRAAEEGGAILCDLQEAFRKASPGGIIGWELMDDHVHPSLRGQELIARSIVRALAERGEGRTAVDPARAASLSDWGTYAERLHVNPYDVYAAAHAMRLLGGIGFYRESNPEFLERFDAVCRRIESEQPGEIVRELRTWTETGAPGGERRPITGMAGRALYELEMYAEAEWAFAAASSAVIPYSSWELQYTYSRLMSRQNMPGGLREEDLRLAGEAIERGRVLLAVGESKTGAAERYMAEMHLMRGEQAPAIPLLESARAKLGGVDRVLADTSLVRACLRMGEVERAREVVAEGIRAGGEHGGHYRDLRAELPEE